MSDYAPSPTPAGRASRPATRRARTPAVPRPDGIQDGRPVAQRLEALQVAADERAGSEARTTSARRGEGVVQRAGTKPNVASHDGRYRIKLSSDREKFTYANAQQLGLQDVLPGYYPVTGHTTNAAGKVASVTATVAGVATNIRLESPIDPPGGGKELLVIDTVAFQAPVAGAAAAQKLFLDVKIGTYTKSGEQFALEGAGWFMRQAKKVEHNIKDSGLDRGSRTKGYDVDKGNAAAFDAEYQHALTSPAGSAQRSAFQDAMQAVVGSLATIQARITASPVRFVGSSLFFVFDLTNPANSQVKLIDPDHPIINDINNLATGAVPADVMTDQSSRKSPSEWATYFDKWQKSFDTGLANFVNDWFMTRKKRL